MTDKVDRIAAQLADDLFDTLDAYYWPNGKEQLIAYLKEQLELYV